MRYFVKHIVGDTSETTLFYVHPSHLSSLISLRCTKLGQGLTAKMQVLPPAAAERTHTLGGAYLMAVPRTHVVLRRFPRARTNSLEPPASSLDCKFATKGLVASCRIELLSSYMAAQARIKHLWVSYLPVASTQPSSSLA
ncbi:hypothetical protein SETIT_9G074200v2 [Setaria italica]|uniref:Uncharacterized protein n=1 Tax=Setaria italica TaxID=4555 RepID=A0A368SE84_SETIT|nr:hypothetical protein SETIT_9G074200v2 [Setaria italica]